MLHPNAIALRDLPTAGSVRGGTIRTGNGFGVLSAPARRALATGLDAGMSLTVRHGTILVGGPVDDYSKESNGKNDQGTYMKNILAVPVTWKMWQGTQ